MRRVEEEVMNAVLTAHRSSVVPGEVEETGHVERSSGGFVAEPVEMSWRRQMRWTHG